MGIRGEYVDNLLFDALLELAESTRLEKISVTQLVAHAGVSRQTFYNHYTDLNDLISRAPFHWVISRSTSPGDRAGIQLSYEFALQHKGIFMQLPGHRGQNNFRESFTDFTGDYFASRYITDDLPQDEQLRRGIESRMYAHAITDIFLDWCDNGLSWPLETLLTAQDDMLPPFVREDWAARSTPSEGQPS